MDFNNQKAVEIYTEKTGLFEAEEHIFKKYLSEPCKILDIGCGAGRTTRVLKDMGHDVIGIDISPLMVEQARKLHPDIEFREGDAAELDFDSGSFDFVLFSFNGIDTIYPEVRRVKAIIQAHRVLRKDGGFIFSSHDLSFAKNNKKRNWRRRPRHYKNYYYKEKTVYGDLLMYYGTIDRNFKTLKAYGGFYDPISFDNYGKGWRYYLAWA